MDDRPLYGCSKSHPPSPTKKGKMSTKSIAFFPIQSDFYKYSVESFMSDMATKTRADYSFQSRVRWSLDNKKSYVTSVILGMAPSKFILASTDACKITSKIAADKQYYKLWKGRGIDFLNIDSNNRVTTLSQFIRNEFGIQSGFYEICGQVIEIIEGQNDTYETLPNVVLKAFLNAVVTVEVISVATRSQLSQLFIRMNDGISLNGPEKRNAVISDFCNTIRDLATTYEGTLKKFFKPNDINRRKVDDFIAGLALIYFHGLSVTISDKSMWSAYECGSTEDQLIGKFASDFKSFITFMGDNLDALPNKNCVLDLFSVMKDLKDNNFNISNPIGFIDDYMKTHAARLTDSDTYSYANGSWKTYKELMRSREANFNKLRREIITRTWKPESYCTQLDNRRSFTKEQKFVAAVRQDWVTPEGKEIEKGKLFDPSVYQGGHITPHADGGSTHDDENCAIQETEDNLKLGRNPIS